MMVPELFIVSVPPPVLAMVRVEAPAVSPTMSAPIDVALPTIVVVLLNVSTPVRNSNVVAALVAIRAVVLPEPALFSTSAPAVKVLVPEVCHERALELLKVELGAPDRLIAPVMRPPLLIVMMPVPAEVAPIARSEAKPPIDVMMPPALLLMMTLPAETLPDAAVTTLTTAVALDVPSPRMKPVLVMVSSPVVLAPRMAEPPFETIAPLLVTVTAPKPLLKA